MFLAYLNYTEHHEIDIIGLFHHINLAVKYSIDKMIDYSLIFTKEKEYYKKYGIDMDDTDSKKYQEMKKEYVKNNYGDDYYLKIYSKILIDDLETCKYDKELISDLYDREIDTNYNWIYKIIYLDALDE